MEFRDFSLLAADTKVAGFIDGLARGELLGSKCASCGALHFPPRSDCPECYSGEFEWYTVEGCGRLIAYTTIFIPPEHFAPDLRATAPFSCYGYHPAPVGLVEMGDGLRVMGWIEGIAAKGLRVGMELAPASAILKDGRATIALREVEVA